MKCFRGFFCNNIGYHLCALPVIASGEQNKRVIRMLIFTHKDAMGAKFFQEIARKFSRTALSPCFEVHPKSWTG